MTTEEKNIFTIKFSGKRSDWYGWFEKFPAWVKHNGYKMLLISKGDQVGVDKIPTQDKYVY